MRQLAFCLFFAFTLAAAIDVGAQEDGCETCEWSERGDRWEGLFEQEISGGSFELQSLHFLEPRDAATDGEQIHLSFWLPEPLELDQIEVWQPRRLYRMKPNRKNYGAGRQDFVWPRGHVIDRLGLPLRSLFTRIKDDAVYYPAKLSTREGPLPSEGYAFVFASGAGIDAFCTIALQGETPKVVRKFDCYRDFGGTIVIEWDGRDDCGQPVGEGEYLLTFDGDMLGETMRPLTASIPFWHRGSFESTASALEP